MNFFKELEKKKKCLGFWKEDALYDNGEALVEGWAIDEEKCFSALSTKEVKELYLESQRVFWLKRKKELKEDLEEKKKKEEELADRQTGVSGQDWIDYSELHGTIQRMKKELSWIEKQLKEVK